MNEFEKKHSIHFEPYSLLRDIVLNFWVVILAALIGFMSVNIWNQSMYTPMYTSTATLIVNIKNSASYSYTNLSSSSEMAKIYTEVFKQPTMKEYAAEHLGEDRFIGSVSASVLDNTNIFTVSVTTSSPETSYEELCAILEVYPRISNSVFSDSVIEIMRSPNFPGSPSNAISDGNRSLVMLGCAGVVLALIVYLSLTRDTVKDEKSFKTKVDAKLFGTVSYERVKRSFRSILEGKKVSLLISHAYASYTFTENFHKIANRIEYLNRTDGNRVFLITSFAEDEGKSTTVANIALALADRGNRVALLDMDFKKPAVHKIFDLKKTESADFASLLSGKTDLEHYKPYPYMKTGVDLMVNFKPHNDYVDWIHGDNINKVFEKLRGELGYDYILIDTPPLSVAADVTTFMQLADKSLVVVRTDYVLAADINDAILSLKEKTDNFAGCILNAVHKEFSLLGQLGFDETGYYGKSGAYSRYDRYASRDHEDKNKN
ncbi:MAG: P-loop NTPase [Clostridia bacterium]|nr:P-loop NTPase [Clostridia bacterium]